MSIVGIFALCRVSVKEKETPIVQKNVVCLLCGNAGDANFNKEKKIMQAYMIFARIQIDS